MSQHDIQSKQDVQKSGVLLVEQMSSRPPIDSVEKNPTKQDVQETLSNTLDVKKSIGSKSSKQDVKKKHSKSKSHKREFSIKTSQEKPGSIVNKENSPETIPMTPQDGPKKKASAIPAQLSKITPVLPISSNLEEVRSYHGMSSEGQHVEESAEPADKNVDHIAELRTKPKYSEWVPHRASNLKQVSSCTIKKKELTWNDDDYLNKVILKSLGETSRAISLERKASVGPFRSATQFERASGFTINVPKKSTRNICGNKTDVGINISISKKSLAKSKSIADVDFDTKNRGDAPRQEKRAVKVDIEVPYMKIFKVVRSKLGFVRNKFQTVRNLTSS